MSLHINSANYWLPPLFGHAWCSAGICRLVYHQSSAGHAGYWPVAHDMCTSRWLHSSCVVVCSLQPVCPMGERMRTGGGVDPPGLVVVCAQSCGAIKYGSVILWLRQGADRKSRDAVLRFWENVSIRWKYCSVLCVFKKMEQTPGRAARRPWWSGAAFQIGLFLQHVSTWDLLLHHNLNLISWLQPVCSSYNNADLYSEYEEHLIFTSVYTWWFRLHRHRWKEMNTLLMWTSDRRQLRWAGGEKRRPCVIRCTLRCLCSSQQEAFTGRWPE